MTGNKWYVYLGEDTIDPVSVSYDPPYLYGGEPVTIKVTPRDGMLETQTVKYRYRCSIDDGDWTDIGEPTASTSMEMTVPEGAAWFCAAAQASDGWGFASTTWVYGPRADVSQLKAYAAVNGVIRKTSKIYVIVDGKVREVKKGYAISGGVVKKFL